MYLESITVHFKHSYLITRKHTERNKERFLKAAETLLESTYTDDIKNSAPNETECIKLYQELSQLWKSAGIGARKWLSNSEQVLKEIPEKKQCYRRGFE